VDALQVEKKLTKMSKTLFNYRSTWTQLRVEKCANTM
jgi:hypothetical protein